MAFDYAMAEPFGIEYNGFFRFIWGLVVVVGVSFCTMKRV